jgi:hypothetical protein
VEPTRIQNHGLRRRSNESASTARNTVVASTKHTIDATVDSHIACFLRCRST